jgi:hypothetical protein
VVAMVMVMVMVMVNRMNRLDNWMREIGGT